MFWKYFSYLLPSTVYGQRRVSFTMHVFAFYRCFMKHFEFYFKRLHRYMQYMQSVFCATHVCIHHMYKELRDQH